MNISNNILPITSTV